MAWTFTDLKYGWKIAAGITLAATTIYVASNTRERVNQADIIELALGTYERCLATQYSTNPVAYYVAPPSFVRSWHSNSYETTNVPGDLVTNWVAVLHTNIFTNVISWRTDRAMLAELDATIKALVPYYCDTNTLYDGSTNVVMLTVTGLWASLGIGDHVSQFTRVPASGTNAATYGELPWRIYKEDLEERYKVLQALQAVRFINFGSQGQIIWNGIFDCYVIQRETATVFNDFQPLRSLTDYLWCLTALWNAFADSSSPQEYYMDSSSNIWPFSTGFWETACAYQGIEYTNYWHSSGRGGQVAISSHQYGGQYMGEGHGVKMRVIGPKIINGELEIIKSFSQQYIQASLPSITYFDWGEHDFWGDTPHANHYEFVDYYTDDAIFTNASERCIREWPAGQMVDIGWQAPELPENLNSFTNNFFSHVKGAHYAFVGANTYICPRFYYCTHKYW